jgi:Asp-tRNA(Asn)/Glu-tRNA(Gln) amidotransferase A subunit family amidase
MEISLRRIIKEALRRVEAVNPELNAFVALRGEQVLDSLASSGWQGTFLLTARA